MLDANQQARVLGVFPWFDGDPALWDAVRRSGQLLQLPSEAVICRQGTRCAHLPLAVAGSARVYKQGENGREITLYHIGPGESCVLTASCILSDIVFPALAVAQGPLQGLVLPAPEVRRWLGSSEAWRRFLLGTLSLRLAEVIGLVEEVAFRRMDERLAEYLVRAAGPSPDPSPILRTHQGIAFDLGTSREVVTRLLRDFEARGLVRTARGAVEVIRPGELLAIAHPPGAGSVP